MDKLKPILAQKFWILSGLCLILPLTGWWLTTSSMATEYTARETTILAAVKGIPQPGPNQNWTKRVDAFNKEEEMKVIQTGDYLWNNQLQYMVWPESMRAGIEKAGYRLEIDAQTRGDYRYVYDKEIVDSLKVVQPLDPIDGTGLVQAPLELIPNAGWGTSPIAPSSKEMWDTQEDMWLYRALFQAINNINMQYESTTIVDSKIKEITYIELRGGTPGGASAAPAAGAGAGAGMAGGGTAALGAAMPGGPGGMMAEKGMGMGTAGAGGMGGMGGGAMTASFDPAEQLGPDEDAAAAATGAVGGMPGTSGAPAAAMPGGPGMGGMAGMAGGPAGKMGMGMGGMGASGAPRKRYIEETPKFKTRGFYMEVVMDHRQVPEFIAELSDCSFPLRVLRYQMVDRDLSDVNSAVVGTGMAGAGMGTGMAAMGGMRTSGSGSASMGMRSAMGKGMSSGMPGEAGLGRGSSRPPTAGMNNRMAAGGEGMGGFGQAAVDLQVAMADPYLVNVAIVGVMTIYLPPPVVGQGQPGATPEATGTPAAAPATATTTTTAPAGGAAGTTATPATATTGAAATGAATTTTDAAATTTPAPAGEAPAAPVEGTAPAAPAETDKPAGEAPAEPAEGTAPAETDTPAEATPTATNPDAPADKAEKPADMK